MLNDNEIKSLAEDSLDIKAFAQTLEEIVSISETPITIGVYGAWGSGKTSLMRMTDDLLTNGANKDNIKTVWFDAWKFDKTHDLRVALIHAILREIEEDKGSSKKLKAKVQNFIKKVNWFGLGKVAIASLYPPSLIILKEIWPFKKNKEDISRGTLDLIGDFEKEFEKLVEEYTGSNGRLIVFIDDLDRCT